MNIIELKKRISKLKILRRIRELEKQLAEQDMQYNAIQSRFNKKFNSLSDVVAGDRQEIFNIKAIVIQIEEELKRIEEVLKNGKTNTH